jgi:hypothetical protein
MVGASEDDLQQLVADHVEDLGDRGHGGR